MKKLKLSITGMHCGSCAASIRMGLEDAGASKASVDFSTGKAVVEFNSSKSSEKKLLDAVKEAGYSAKTE